MFVDVEWCWWIIICGCFYLKFICLSNVFILFRQNQESPVAMLQSFGHWMTLLGLGSRMSCNQPALKFIRLSLAIRMRNVPFVGKKAGGETRSEQPPFTYTFPRFFTLSILMFFTHLFTSTMIFQYFSWMCWRKALVGKVAMRSPSVGMSSIAIVWIAQGVPGADGLPACTACIVCSGLVPVFSCQLAILAQLRLHHVLWWRAHPLMDFCNPDTNDMKWQKHDMDSDFQSSNKHPSITKEVEVCPSQNVAFRAPLKPWLHSSGP